MKVLILGPSGSGKTYISHALQRLGISAFDDGDIKGLSAWYDKSGNKVAVPETADEALENHYSFLWSKRFLAKFLDKFSGTDVYIFGGSGNIFDMFSLFDQVYFLKITPELQKERLYSSSRENPMMDRNENGLVVWGDWFEEQARKYDIPFVDASQTPEEIFAVISRKQKQTNKEKRSRTSLGVSILRAVHQELDSGSKILADEVILRLLPPDMIRHIRENPDRYSNVGARRLRSHVLLRSRYAEDCLAEAFQRGIRQYIILGAGLDTFAYRRPEWASELKIFELDHPASQLEKTEKLAYAGIGIPENLTFIPIDLESRSLSDALSGTSFHFDQPVFISWLGVMPYLYPETNDKILQFIASLPVSSELVFTFAPKDNRGKPHPLAAGAAALNEPWLTRINSDELWEKLIGFGFSQVSFLKSKEAEKRYYADSGNNLPPPWREVIVRAVV